jgi:hypothetical protein
VAWDVSFLMGLCPHVQIDAHSNQWRSAIASQVLLKYSAMTVLKISSGAVPNVPNDYVPLVHRRYSAQVLFYLLTCTLAVDTPQSHRHRREKRTGPQNVISDNCSSGHCRRSRKYLCSRWCCMALRMVLLNFAVRIETY